MKIESISRKVTGSHYSNISFTATLEEGEDPIKCAVDLDKTCLEALTAIDDNSKTERERDNKKFEMLERIETLKKAINNNDVEDLPF